MASNNMYRVGDFVYFETSASAPYQIRKIDELNKTATGAVEAKVICFYRRRDISNALLQLADKHQKDLMGEDDKDNDTSPKDETDDNSLDSNKMSSEQKHRIKHRELFLSRQVETLPATHIRGKCQVTLHNHETENTMRYLDREESFFYQLVYDPIQRTLLADKGEIRVGNSYQADVPSSTNKPEEESDDRDSSLLESLVWSPDHNLSGAKLDEYLLLARSVGTLARAYDNTSSIRQPNLLMSAAAASRDITKQRALDVLFDCDFDIPEAISQLIPKGGSTLFRDEMEEWSASEGNLFEEALEKYGKFFHDIHNDFLPWKTPKGIVEYYYMWKTTDHYVQHKRIKAAESEHKLKQVYIPNYNKPNPAVLYTSKTAGGCESCNAQSSPQWYSWGPQNVQCKLCLSCWNYWKRYGGLKYPSKIGNSVLNGQSGTALAGSTTSDSGGSKSSAATGIKPLSSESLWPSSGSLSGPPNSKNRTGFFMLASPSVRVGRRLCDELLRCNSLAKKPFSRTINVTDFQKQLSEQLNELDVSAANSHLSRGRVMKDLKSTLNKLSTNADDDVIPEILKRDGIPPKSDKEAFPRDHAAMEKLNQSVFADPNSTNTENLSINKINSGENQPTTSTRKRPLENTESNDRVGEPQRKRPLTQNQSSIPVKKTAVGKEGGTGSVLFMADAAIKKQRRILMNQSLRKLTRCPWRKLDSDKYNVGVLGLKSGGSDDS